MCGGEDRRGKSLPATEIAPREIAPPGGGFDTSDERDVVEPCGRQHRFEIPQVGDLGGIAIACHRFVPGPVTMFLWDPVRRVEQSGNICYTDDVKRIGPAMGVCRRSGGRRPG